MNTLRKSRRHAALAFAAGLLALTPLLTPFALRAQSSNSEEKISLMVSALQARDEGNLATAKDDLQRLLVLAPNDPTAQQLLDSVNAQLAAQGSAPTTTAAAPTATTATAAPAADPAAASSAPAAAPAPAVTPAAPAPATPAADPAPAPAASTSTNLSATQQALKLQIAKQKADIAAAQTAIAQANKATAAGQFDQANQAMIQLQSQLPPGLAYDGVRAQAASAQAAALSGKAKDAYNQGNDAQAQVDLTQYEAVFGTDDWAQSFQAKLTAGQSNPYRQPVDPAYEKSQDEISHLLVQARAEYLYGDYESALATYNKVISESPGNMEAKGMQSRIYNIQYQQGYIDHENTRLQMLNDVDTAWVRPEVYQGTNVAQIAGATNPVVETLRSIIIPHVEFKNLPLSQVVETLSELSTQYDKNGKGVNIVLVTTGAPADHVNPLVNLTLRDQSLESIIINVCKTVSYNEEVESGVVTLRYGDNGSTQMETRDFPMPQATLTRLTGYHGTGGGGGGDSTTTQDPFATSASSSNSTAAAPAADAGSSGGTSSETTDDLKNFFMNAGVDFPTGARLAYDGNKIWVTNSSSNLDRLANLLQRYSEIKQVEIESRFLEVQQGAMQELGFQWSVTNPSHPNNSVNTGGNLRLLGDAFPSGSAGAQATTITTGSVVTNPVTGATTQVNGPTTTVPQAIPSLPGGINVGAGATSVAQGVLGVIDGYSVDVVINALEQTEGADLMSAPKVTVLSQRTAQIVVAQQLRYPQNFSPTQSQVGNNGGSINGGGAGVTITAGAPQDFDVEQVGVVMEVTPTVEDDDSISLKLEPKVTEFEGFIEYGGTSVAISGGTTVTVPSGFIQPVFSVRDVRTEVTIFDGATVVIGGLTREQVETVHDSVPVLGDIPLIGKLFQSKGETSQKRNLMIFVTANLISPGGSPARQSFPNLPAGSLFQEPTLVTPGSAVRRTATTATPPSAQAATGAPSS
jgi:general secretion pathway protein D